MAFHEPVDPFVEKLQVLIDDLNQDINYQKFEKILEKIDTDFPFVDLLEFLELYVDGEYSKEFIKIFHLLGYHDYYKLLQILKLPKKRRSILKNSISRKTNLEDDELTKRYEFLQKRLLKFQNQIKNKINRNVLRAIIILQLYSNGQNFSSIHDILQSLPNAIKNYEHLILAPHISLSAINDEKIIELTESILLDLKNNFFLEVDSSNNLRLENHQLQISDYIFNIIENRKDGITYQELITSLKHKLPILFQIPPALIEITLHEFIMNRKIVKKEGYWKFKPFYDQYFTFDNYLELSSELTNTYSKNREFFGRKITPEQFIKELLELQKGDFEDQDDQVTRIAGMIMTNSNMMTHSPNDLEEFDFTVDLSRYEFTQEQQEVMQNLNLVIKSEIMYIKVMINEKLTFEKMMELIRKLEGRGRNEQGFVMSFFPIDKLQQEILKDNKTIQIISEKELKEWCKITPIIPSRRGAVAIVRQGDNRGSIVKIKSINYESGLADIILFPKMNEATQYIGSLEEITIPVSMENFIESSDIYFQFLAKLRQISNINVFRKIVSEGLLVEAYRDKIPQINIIPYEKQIECIFDTGFKTRIDLSELTSGWDSLTYTIDDLFSCTCFQWNQKSRTHGLCDHLIFTLNESIKKILASKTNLTSYEIEGYLRQIEHRMDLFLNRLKYSNYDDSTSAKCLKCGQTAYTLFEVDDKFGFRQMEKNNKFSLRRQSQCKKCR